ncbi:hypothetical protein ACOMHN_004972 [Nucella lapillus]
MTTPTVTQTCHQFCQLALENKLFQDNIATTRKNDSSNVHDNSNADDDGDSHVGMVFRILVALVVALLLTSVVLGFCWYRSRRSRRRQEREKGELEMGEGRACVEKSSSCGQSSGGTKESSRTGCYCGAQDIGSDWSSKEKGVLRNQQKHPEDVELGSLCEAFSDEEFYDVWSTTPASRRFDAL